jgi:hypothetical protein
LLCGLQGGAIVSFRLVLDTSESKQRLGVESLHVDHVLALSIAQIGRVNIALVDVNLVDDQAYPSMVLATCGEEFCRITYDHYGIGGISVKSIYLSDSQEVLHSYQGDRDGLLTSCSGQLSFQS